MRLHFSSSIAIAAVFALGGCSSRNPAVDSPTPAAAESDAACARPAVLVRNLTGATVSLYKAKGMQRTFVAEVPAGGAYQHAAEPSASYYLRSARGQGRGIEAVKPVTGIAEQARVDRVCLD